MKSSRYTRFKSQFVLVLMWGATSPVLGDESDLLRAKAAAAIAIHNASHTADSAIFLPASKIAPQPAKRSVVTMYTATWCAPCQQAKAELKSAKLPFELRFEDVSQGGQPDWCESIPAFAWVVNGQTRYVLGFPGVAQLVASWERTLVR